VLSDVLETFRRWMYLPDPAALYAALATVAANRFEDESPLWLALVGPPGGGKSEILMSLYGLSDVRPTATLTEPALLSGTAKKERADGASGGILREIGSDKPGIIVCKDFGSVLSMHPEQRRLVLAALREIYDGSWHRDLGVDGHRRLSWTGKVGMVVGVTPVIDRHHGVMSAMGERLVLLRLPKVDPIKQGSKAWEQAGSQGKMHAELRDVVTAFFKRRAKVPEPTTPEQGLELVYLSVLVTKCRSSVERDSYTREIELIPESEAPTRLTGQLDRLFCGLRAIGVPSEEAWAITVKAALDSMPVLRRIVIEALLDVPEPLMGEAETTLADVAEAVQHPSRTTERALQDLAGHGVVIRHGKGKGIPATFELDPWVAERFRGLRAAQEAVTA
jgi:hypothetical protein